MLYALISPPWMTAKIYETLQVHLASVFPTQRDFPFHMALTLLSLAYELPEDRGHFFSMYIQF